MGAFRVGTRPGEFVFSFLTQSSPERVVGVCPDLGIASNEIVKEQMFQTTSKKIVRPSEKQKPRAFVKTYPSSTLDDFMDAAIYLLLKFCSKLGR